MADITYCMNKDCPFKDCERHLTNAPLNMPVSMAWIDGTCRRYIGWVYDELKRKEGRC